MVKKNCLQGNIVNFIINIQIYIQEQLFWLARRLSGGLILAEPAVTPPPPLMPFTQCKSIAQADSRKCQAGVSLRINFISHLVPFISKPGSTIMCFRAKFAPSPPNNGELINYVFIKNHSSVTHNIAIINIF